MMRVHLLVRIPSLRTSLFCTHFVMPQGQQERSWNLPGPDEIKGYHFYGVIKKGIKVKKLTCSKWIFKLQQQM